MDALLGRETLAGFAANDNGGAAGAGRLEAELGYGFALFDGGFTGTPHLGFGLSDGGREYRIGWRHGLAESGTASFEFGLEATRTEPANDPGPGAAPEHAVGFKLTAPVVTPVRAEGATGAMATGGTIAQGVAALASGSLGSPGGRELRFPDPAAGRGEGPAWKRPAVIGGNER